MEKLIKSGVLLNKSKFLKNKLTLILTSKKIKEWSSLLITLLKIYKEKTYNYKIIDIFPVSSYWVEYIITNLSIISEFLVEK